MEFELLLISILQRSLIAAIPLLLATLGEIVTERSGILNLGVEGMMAAGAIAGFVVALSSGSFVAALLCAIGVSAFLGLVHGLVSVYVRVNQTVSGLAITMLGLGIAGLWGKPFIGKATGLHLPTIRLPLLGDVPVLGPILNGLDVFFYLTVVLTLAIWFFLGKTKAGTALLTCGENPRASEAHGLRIELIRVGASAFGGAMAGIGGAFLSLSYASSWSEAMTGGRGWIAVALTIFALWRPLRAVLGAWLFGGIFVLQYVLQPLGIQSNVLGMLPYLATLIILISNGFFSDHRLLHAPAALGEPFRRGER